MITGWKRGIYYPVPHFKLWWVVIVNVSLALSISLDIKFVCSSLNWVYDYRLKALSIHSIISNYYIVNGIKPCTFINLLIKYNKLLARNQQFLAILQSNWKPMKNDLQVICVYNFVFWTWDFGDKIPYVYNPNCDIFLTKQNR